MSTERARVDGGSAAEGASNGKKSPISESRALLRRAPRACRWEACFRDLGLSGERTLAGDRTLLPGFRNGGPDVFLDSYTAIPSAARWAAIVFQPSAFLTFSSRYHLMYSSRARTKDPFVAPFQLLA